MVRQAHHERNSLSPRILSFVEGRDLSASVVQYPSSNYTARAASFRVHQGTAAPILHRAPDFTSAASNIS